MQPILAESAPHRGRALVLAAVLTVAASIAAVAVASPRPHTRWHRHHHLPYNGQCPYGYVYSPASSSSTVTAVYVGR